MRFAGRDRELDQIRERWRMASDVDNPWTQVVVIKAERGVGKTRLALEFFRWLSEHEDAAGPRGYWPDGVAILDRNIDVNPDPANCRYDTPIPFLWWGLRGADTQVENAFAGDAVSSYDRFLAPHLVALTIRARMLGSGREILDVWRDVAKGELASWTGYDTVMAVGEGLLKTVSIVTGNLRESRGQNARSAGERRQVDRVDAVLEELEGVFNPNAFSYARTPGVILIDDAQFSTGDSSLALFAEPLMHTAVAQSWPVMILVTHWRRELAPEFATTNRSFAAILHHALQASAGEPRGGEGLSGGYLHGTNYLEIDLQPVADLAGVLAEELPGLTPAQAGALLDHAGGNPRHLVQIVTFLRENEDFFEDFDTSRALTDEGLEEALEETHDIFKVVLRRLRDAPTDVQEAVCIASTLGVRFVSDIVEDIMKAHLGHDAADALSRASDPYSMTRTGQSRQLAEFAERLFFLVAERRRKSLRSLSDRDALDSALPGLPRRSSGNRQVASELGLADGHRLGPGQNVVVDRQAQPQPVGQRDETQRHLARIDRDALRLGGRAHHRLHPQDVIAVKPPVGRAHLGVETRLVPQREKGGAVEVGKDAARKQRGGHGEQLFGCPLRGVHLGAHLLRNPAEKIFERGHHHLVLGFEIVAEQPARGPGGLADRRHRRARNPVFRQRPQRPLDQRPAPVFVDLAMGSGPFFGPGVRCDGQGRLLCAA